MKKNATRKARAARSRQKLIVYGGIGLVVVALVAIFIFANVAQSSAPILASAKSSDLYQEETIPIQGRNHIPRGQPHDPYNSNPPTSGPHYADKMIPAQAGFYDESNMLPDEDLVHSEEHGYVIIWYDCTKAPNGDCDTLKSGIKQLISSINSGYHLIAMPRDGQMPTVLATTSWGKLERYDAFDVDKIKSFITRNLDNSPEPGGP